MVRLWLDVCWSLLGQGETAMELLATDRARLKRIARDRDCPVTHDYRVRVVLLAGAGLGSTRTAKAVGKSEPTVRRWLARFGEAGIDGLLRDASRPPGRRPLDRVPTRGAGGRLGCASPAAEPMQNPIPVADFDCTWDAH